MAEVVEILGMRRERKQKTTDNENMETGVKIHHPVGSRISMTLDEVTLRNKQDRHQTNKTKKNTTTKFEQIKGDTKKEDEFDALYTDGPMVASIPASKTDNDACCGGDSQGKTSCCGGSDSNSKESASSCCGGDDSKDSKSGACCGGNADDDEEGGSACCAQPTFEQQLASEAKYKREQQEEEEKKASATTATTATTSAATADVDIKKMLHHHAIFKMVLTRFFLPVVIGLILMKMGMVFR